MTPKQIENILEDLSTEINSFNSQIVNLKLEIKNLNRKKKTSLKVSREILSSLEKNYPPHDEIESQYSYLFDIE